MDYFTIEPEVAGGTGPGTLSDRSVHPPLISRLHYRFYGWLGDALLASFPCFIVTKELSAKILAAGLRGVRFDDVEVDVSQQFRDFYPDRKLPDFRWLRIDGQPGRDDFGLAGPRLVVSTRALEILREEGISHAVIGRFLPT